MFEYLPFTSQPEIGNSTSPVSMILGMINAETRRLGADDTAKK